MGFSEILGVLKSAKKPIVGHNLMFDLVFTYQQFINDLPPTYDEYQQKLHQYFGEIYDTKSMSLASGCFGRTNLQAVYERVT